MSNIKNDLFLLHNGLPRNKLGSLVPSLVNLSNGNLLDVKADSIRKITFDSSVSFCFSDLGSPIRFFVSHENILITVHENETITLWDISTGITTILPEHDDSVLCKSNPIFIDPIGLFLIINCTTHFFVFDIQKMTYIHGFFSKSGPIDSYIFSPNSHYLVTLIPENETIYVWDIVNPCRLFGKYYVTANPKNLEWEIKKGEYTEYFLHEKIGKQRRTIFRTYGNIY